MNDNKIDDEDSLASTIKPPPRFSQRPTTPFIPEKLIIKQYAPIKYKFYLIGIIIVTIIIVAIIFITKPLQSKSMPAQSVFNLAPIIIPTEPVHEIKPIEISNPTNSSKSIEKLVPQSVKKIDIKKQVKDKDYGI